MRDLRVVDPKSRQARPAGVLLSAVRHDRSEALQVERPTVAASDAFGHALPAVAVAVEVAVLELDSRSIGRLRDEADLDLTRLREVGLDLPVRVDVPGEDETIWRLVGKDARPLAFGAIDA